MIYIREIVPRKMPGLSSFLVSFAFNPVIVDTLKTLPLYYYHKSDQSWEIPANDLAQALDALTFLDSIQLIMLPETEEVPNSEDFSLTQAEIEQFHFTPFPHQIDAINYGLNPDHTKWLLLDSMGLGKSLEIIGLAETLKRRGQIDHCLVICGVDSLRQNWKREIQKFSTESVLVLGEKISKKGKISYATLPERAKIIKEPISEFFIVVNAATLRSDDVIAAMLKSTNKFGMIAVDEAHRFATKSSQQGSNLLKLKSEYKIAATGTLLINSPISCYMPLAWTENDHSTLTNFKYNFCKFGGFGDKQVIGYKNLDVLKEELSSCMIRRTLDQVRDNMPLKNINYEIVEMSTEHRKFYDAIVDGVKEEADKIHLNSSNLLALTTRLRQATADPSILTTQNIVSSKVERAVEIATDLLEQGEKVVIFSVFKQPCYQIAKMLKQYKPLLGTGDYSDQDVQNRMVQFQEDASTKLFIGTHAKMGTGFTLNAASYMICIDQPYTDASFSQSTDRIWRITNTRPAFVTVLTCNDTIDERVREIVETKKDLADFVVDDIQNELAVSDALTDELRKIITSL
jgi:SNF2 family DNA or RNA helicase